MSRDNFEKKQPGDKLSAKWTNKVSKISRDQSTKWPGSFFQGFEKGSSEFPPHSQRVVIVTAVEDQDALLFQCRLRFYNYETSTWETDEDQGPYNLDSSAFGDEGADRETGANLAVGDLVTAYWDDQRDAWIPILTGTTTTSTTCLLGTCTYQATLVEPTTTTGDPATTTTTASESTTTTSGAVPTWVLISCDCGDPLTSTTTSTSTTPSTPTNDCQNCTAPANSPTLAQVDEGATVTTCCNPPTTTTPPPCSGACRYSWSESGAEWVVSNDQCSDDCECDSPPQFCGSADCDNVQVGCVEEGGQTIVPDCATTTTSAITTTTVCPATTTTQSLGCTNCRWHYFNGWHLIEDGCLSADCFCFSPEGTGNL